MTDVIDKAIIILAADDDLMDRTTRAWSAVAQKIEERAGKARPAPKVYEVHHETQVARQAFLTAIVSGQTVEEATTAALDRIQIVSVEVGVW